MSFWMWKNEMNSGNRGAGTRTSRIIFGREYSVTVTVICGTFVGMYLCDIYWHMRTETLPINWIKCSLWLTGATTRNAQTQAHFWVGESLESGAEPWPFHTTVYWTPQVLREISAELIKAQRDPIFGAWQGVRVSGVALHSRLLSIWKRNQGISVVLSAHLAHPWSFQAQTHHVQARFGAQAWAEMLKPRWEHELKDAWKDLVGCCCFFAASGAHPPLGST